MQTLGKAGAGVAVNRGNVIGDHMWIWRADHGSGVGWISNAADTGLTVNGPDVTMYGLFVEHAPNTPGVRFTSMVTVSLGATGTISHIVNNTGGPSNPSTNVANLVGHP